MIDPTFQIRKYYVDLLSGISVPVVNIETAGASSFVVVSSRAQAGGTKGGFDHFVSTVFEIVVKTSGNYGGDKMAEDIAAEITPLVVGSRPNPIYGQTENFKIITCQVESSDPFHELSNTGRTIRKVIQITNYVTQLN
jgi:hypothetical protein